MVAGPRHSTQSTAPPLRLAEGHPACGLEDRPDVLTGAVGEVHDNARNVDGWQPADVDDDVPREHTRRETVARHQLDDALPRARAVEPVAQSPVDDHGHDRVVARVRPHGAARDGYNVPLSVNVGRVRGGDVGADRDGYDVDGHDTGCGKVSCTSSTTSGEGARAAGALSDASCLSSTRLY